MEENFSPQQSLELIQSMITKTKTNIAENRFFFLLWGWVSFAAMISQFFLKVIVGYEKHYLVWLIVFPAIIVTMVYAARRHKKRMARTYIGDSMRHLWTGIGISFMILVLIFSFIGPGWLFPYPFFILLYGLGTFVSGRILKFTPLIIGGIFNWMLACVAANVSFDYQLLCGAAAILTSYIIPGHLLGNIKK